ncbi:MAG: hypothetical protein K8U57_27400 [Planctomycetes bacterium]|nr:hypothetical protein [Planctomycetota bacterium]
MTRPRRILSLEQADNRLGELSSWLSAAGQPRKQVRELLEIAAFYRGEVDRLRARDGEPGQKSWTAEEKKRKG